jgi:membrane protease YdiL (CAAX protease family)
MRLVMFFLTTYAVTWSCWFAAASLTTPGLRYPLFLLGTFMPGIVALAFSGRTGAIAILSRLFRWQTGLRWYVFAFSYIAAIKLTAALLHRLLTGAWPRFGDESIVIMIAATIFSTVIGGQAGEEIGWRGFALPRLAEHLGVGGASVLLGVIWACWHLPLFFVAGADTQGQSFPLYLLQVTAVSVALAWLYEQTGGSLLLTMLMHAAINNTKDIVPSAVPGATNPFALSTSLIAWLTVALLWICAAFFLRTMPSARRAAGSMDAVPRVA